MTLEITQWEKREHTPPDLFKKILYFSVAIEQGGAGLSQREIERNLTMGLMLPPNLLSQTLGVEYD